MRFEDLAGKKVVIWGAGREGRAAHAELTKRGIESVIAVTDPGVVGDGAVSGSAAQALLESAEVILKSPGVPHASPDFLRVRGLGIPVTSLTDLWLSDNSHRVIAVTGTKGKSTTSALIHHLLDAVDVTSSLVGNGGTPVTTGDHAGAQIAIAEISSYQAADLTTSPRAAVITSLYPEHLPWHGGFDQYVHDKLNLVAHGPEVVVVPETAGELKRLAAASSGPGPRFVSPATMGLSASEAGIVWDGVGALPASEIPLRGLHNLTNVALALTAVCVFAAVGQPDRERMLDSIRSFGPLAHRLEAVPSTDGRTWVDDSLATAPEAVVAALETYPSDRVTLIVGGADRGLSFAPLRSYLAGRPIDSPVTVIAVGPAGARLVEEAGESATVLRLAPDFATALQYARASSAISGVVLLSPGAPSFDEFVSFEERSAVFRAAAALE